MKCHIEILSESGVWEDEATHKQGCDRCRNSPEGWIAPHGQSCRHVDEHGVVRKPFHALFEELERLGLEYRR